MVHRGEQDERLIGFGHLAEAWKVRRCASDPPAPSGEWLMTVTDCDWPTIVHTVQLLSPDKKNTNMQRERERGWRCLLSLFYYCAQCWWCWCCFSECRRRRGRLRRRRGGGGVSPCSRCGRTTHLLRVFCFTVEFLSLSVCGDVWYDGVVCCGVCCDVMWGIIVCAAQQAASLQGQVRQSLRWSQMQASRSSQSRQRKRSPRCCCRRRCIEEQASQQEEEAAARQTRTPRVGSRLVCGWWLVDGLALVLLSNVTA